MSDEMKICLSLIAHHYGNGLGLATAERKVVVAHADFEGVAERRGLDDADGRAWDDAHLHQAARHRARAAHGRHPRVTTRVERDDCRPDRLGPLQQFIYLSGCGVGETHKRSPMMTKDSRLTRHEVVCATFKNILLLKIDFNFILGSFLDTAGRESVYC